MDFLLILVLGLVVVAIAWVIGVYNGLVKLRNQVKNAWAQIDVQLKRRHDLIPNLVEVVKDYMEYEQETLEKVVKARNMAIQAEGVPATAEAENMLSGALKSLFAVVEAYPDLKSNQNVMQLQEELTSTENKISFARQYYNDSVMRFNTKQEVFPANMIASNFGFKLADHFEVAEEERENVKVNLR